MKKISKYLTLFPIALITLTACDGTSISRRQAKQALQIISTYQQNTESDTSSTYIGATEISLTIETIIIEGTVPHTYEETYDVSLKKSLCAYSYEETLDIETIATYQNYYFIGSDGVYYSKEKDISTNSYITTKDSYNASTAFFSKYGELQPLVAALVTTFDQPLEFYDALVELDDIDSSLISESYHTKRNGHLKANIVQYKSTLKSAVEQKTYFSYNNYVLEEMSITDGYDNSVEIEIDYSVSLSSPNPYANATEVGEPYSEDTDIDVETSETDSETEVDTSEIESEIDSAESSEE